MTKADHLAALRDHLARVRSIVRGCRTARSLINADDARELAALDGDLDAIETDLGAQIDDLQAGRYDRARWRRSA